MACPEPHRLTLRAEAVSGTHRLEVEPHTAAHLSRGRPGWCLGRRLNIALAVVPLESGQSRNMEHMIFVFLSFFLVEVRVVFFFFFQLHLKRQREANSFPHVFTAMWEGEL